jgi:hypothetical protein
MKKKNSLYKTTVVVSMMFLGLVGAIGCSGCATAGEHLFSKSSNLPIESFVRVSTTTHARICKENKSEDKEEPTCKDHRAGASSSGAFVGHSEANARSHYVLTAGHSCLGAFDGLPASVKKNTTITAHIITVQMDSGRLFAANIIAINREADTCLLRVDNMTVFPLALKVAEEPPKRGERVYNLAAPLGIFSPGMVMLYEGFYTGVLRPRGWDIFSLPTKPGSSGSVIINHRNEIVGMIFAGFRSIETMAISPRLKDIRTFLHRAIPQGEMGLWLKSQEKKAKAKENKR